jgi:RNA-directed DNA polymerase
MSLKLTSSPEELRAAFYALETREDIAALLDIDDLQLRYHLYISDKSRRYTVFAIPKKSGGEREISAPISALKIIQRKLNQVLQSVYQPKPSAHGFVHERSIRTNAKVHARRRFVLNIDLKDFFPTINFGRVRGMFMGNPYFRNQEIATVLAQICCFNNQLPQGAPTSPVVSNMICARLDAKLQQLAKKHKCTYSRYVDDITFSTSQTQFPSSLAWLTDDGEIELGNELLEVISDNHFEINPEKVRLQTRNRRQEVTGLTVNKFPNVTRKYIDQIRGMLHAWANYGLESTQERYWQKYNCKHRNLLNLHLSQRSFKERLSF